MIASSRPPSAAFNVGNVRHNCASATCVHNNMVFAGRPMKRYGAETIPGSSFDQSLEKGAIGAILLAGAFLARHVTSAKAEPGGGTSWLRELATPGTLCVLVLVFQKCTADALTWFTKARCGMTYSGSNVTLVSEVLKFPILLTAIGIIKSPSQVWPTIKSAATRKPLAMWWVGLLYAAQNLLYFVCLQYCSAAAYQVLSQSKLIFTAGFMSQMLNKQFSQTQIWALALLLLGTLFTQFAEVSGPAVLSGSAPWLGAALTVLSALLSALPNVFYERLLKESEKDEWVTNLQLTTWICLWVILIKLGGMLLFGASGHIPTFAEATAGFTWLVWVIVGLKTLNCVIVPATLKYADNILYGYAKPMSIVLTCAATAAATSQLPPLTMVAGIFCVVVSVVTYGRG